MPVFGSVRHLGVTAGERIELGFDQGNASFERTGTDLTIKVDGGGTVILDNFFGAGDNTLPTFVLQDGDVVDAADILRAFDPGFNVSTASGPSAATSPSSGLGGYADDASRLLAGVGRLNTLGAEQWDHEARVSLNPQGGQHTIFDGTVPGGNSLTTSGGSEAGDGAVGGDNSGGNIFPTISATDVTVDESRLANGTNPDAAALTQTGVISLNGHGRAVTLTVTGSDDVAHEVTFNADGSVKAGLNTVITTEHGDMTITGSNMAADGTVNVTYSYRLDHNAAQSGVGADGANDTVDDLVGIAVTNAGGDTAFGTIHMTIEDDAPNGGVVVANFDQHNLTGAGATTTGSIPGFAFGADGHAAADYLSIEAPAGLTSQGGVITYQSDGEGRLTGWAGATQVFSLTVNIDGTYSYTQYRLIDGNPQGVPFTVRAVDGDSDSATSTITIAPAGACDDRFVMYTGPQEANFDGKAITGNVLGNDPGGVAGNKLVSVTNGVYGTAVINAATGEVTYTVATDAHLRIGAEAGGIVRDYVEYTAKDAAGHTYTKTIEVVIDRDAGGSSLFLSPGDVSGETHQSYIATDGRRLDTQTIQTGAGNDIFKVAMDITGAKISMLDGDDVFKTIGAGGRDGAKSGVVLQQSTLDMGAGNDLVDISSSNASAVVNSTLIAGAGSDTIRIGGNVTGSVIALGSNIAGIDTADVAGNFLTVNGQISAGTVYGTGGKDVVNVTGAGNLAALSSSTIQLGSGADTLVVKGGGGVCGGSISASSDTEGDYYEFVGTSATRNDTTGLGFGMCNTALNAGGGNDTILITGTVNALQRSVVNAGDGDNFIKITGTSSNSSGVAESTVNLGSGSNSVSCTATTYGMYQGILDGRGGSAGNSFELSALRGMTDYSTIYAGDGNDVIKITGTDAGLGIAFHSSVYLGGGSDVITVSGGTGISFSLIDGSGDSLGDVYTITGTTSQGMNNSTLNAGGGADIITVSGKTDGLSGGSILVSGGGSDHVVINGGTGSALNKGIVALGQNASGADAAGAGDINDLIVNGNVTSSSRIYGSAGTEHVTINGKITGSIIDLGAGDDHLHLNGTVTSSALHGGQGVDVLHLDGAGALGGGVQTLKFSDLLSTGGGGNTTDGFEAVSLTGSHTNLFKVNVADVGQNTLHMDSALEAGKFSGGNGGLSGQMVLRIMGDAADTVQLNQTDWSGTHQTPQTTVVYDGITYNDYTSNDNHHLLIQTNVHVNFA